MELNCDMKKSNAKRENAVAGRETNGIEIELRWNGMFCGNLQCRECVQGMGKWNLWRVL